MRSAEREQLVEIFRDEHDRRAARRARVEQAAVHIGGRADVEAARRLVREHEARVPSGGRAPRITFCMLPPERRRIGASGRGSARRSRGWRLGALPAQARQSAGSRGAATRRSVRFPGPGSRRSTARRRCPRDGGLPECAPMPARTAARGRAMQRRGKAGGAAALRPSPCRRGRSQAPPGRCRRRRRCRRSRLRAPRARRASRPARPLRPRSRRRSALSSRGARRARASRRLGRSRGRPSERRARRAVAPSRRALGRPCGRRAAPRRGRRRR